MHHRMASGLPILILMVLFALLPAIDPILAGPGGRPSPHDEQRTQSPPHLPVYLQDEHPCLQFSTASYQVNEQQQEAMITVELSHASDSEVRVRYATYGQTVYDDTVYGRPMAMPGIDYADTVGSLVFAPGEMHKSFAVPILKDKGIEQDEAVYLELSRIEGDVTTGRTGAFLTITDPDYNPFGVFQFSAVQYQVNEDAGNTAAGFPEQRTTTTVITVERTIGLSGTVSVDYATSEQTAKATLDYEDVAGTLVFTDGEATRSFTLTIRNDWPTENDETLRLFLANPTGGATLGERDAAELTIVDVPAVHFEASSYRFGEGEGRVDILVRLTAPVRAGEEIVVTCEETGDTSAAASVASASSDLARPPSLALDAPGWAEETAGTPTEAVYERMATLAHDYTFSPQDLRFLPGEQEKVVSLTINEDDDIEDEESFFLALTPRAASRVRLGTPSRTRITIQDNDGISGGTLQFDRTTYEVAEGRAIMIVVERTDILSGTVSVRYSTSDGTAQAGTDYTEQSGVLVFPDGVSRATFGIATISNEEREPDETVRIRLSLPTNGATIALTETLLTIRDGNEAPPQALTVSSPFVLPGQDILFLATGGRSVTVSGDGREQHLPLYDDGTHGDALAGDGLYATTWSASGAGTVQAALDAGTGEQETTERVELEIIADPELLVLTDWRELYAEFQETGMEIDEDLNANDQHDFLELVERIRQYAARHRGMVVDLPTAITLNQGYLYAYAALPYEGGVWDRSRKGRLIDQLIARLDIRAAHHFRQIAIVGDDQVVPFYRVFDPANYFEQYYPGDPSDLRRGRDYIEDRGGTRGNPVLEDLNQGYLMSDVPYSLRSYQDISEAAWYPQFSASKALPQPDMGIGRVLARRPLELVRAIDRYEEPLMLRPDQARAALFVGESSGVDPGEIAERSQKPLLETWFADHPDRLAIPSQGAWSVQDFSQALTERNLVSFVGGSAHYAYGIKSGGAPVRGYASDLPAQTLEHPVLLVALGECFGLSLSNAPDGVVLTRTFSETLVNALARVGATVFAPSSVAYLYPESEGFASPNLQELMASLFIDRLLNAHAPTTGEVWQELFSEYHRTDPALVETPFLSTHLFHIVGSYGMVLYGLPTQPIVHSAAAARMELTTEALQGEPRYHVTAMVSDANDTPIAGKPVRFEADKGVITPVWSYTDENGQATTTLSNTERWVGEFLVTASTDAIEAQTSFNVAVSSCTAGEKNDTPQRSRQLALNTVCQGAFASEEVGTDDYYRVLMDQQSDLTLVLRDISDEADYDLFIVDATTGETLAEAQHSGNHEERITLPRQRPGSYSVRVHLHQEPPPPSPASYTLALLAPSAHAPSLARGDSQVQSTPPTTPTTDPDCTAWVSFTQEMYYIDEHAGTATIRVVYEGDTSQAVTVPYEVVAGSASAEDFEPTEEGILRFPASPDDSPIEATFPVTITNDGLVENEYEFAQLSLDYPTPGWPICRGRDEAKLYIHDTTPRPERTALTISSPYVLPGQQEIGASSHLMSVGQQVYVVATIDPQDQDTDREKEEVTVCLPAEETCTPLSRKEEDRGGVYVGTVHLPATSVGSVTLVLNVGGEAKRSQRLSVTDNPRTIILTDWNALYAEFLDTGMQPGWEDRNNNGLHDFFELVERVRTYAEAHEGIVMDLSVVFPDDHFDYSSFDARKQRGMDMDRVIEAVCTRSQEYGATGCQNVVIVGSDQVVPFYRVFDPLNSYNFADRSFDPYGTHSLERGEHGNHPLLQDLGQGYLPSDLPYSIQAFQEITPDSWRSLEAVGKKEHWPRPDIGIGRIFAPTPYDLVAAIDRYETPIFLSQDKARASILIGSTDVLGHADFDVGQGQFASKLFGRFANRLKIPASGSWNQADFVQALRADDLVSAWGHGNYASIGIEASDPLTADSLKHLWRDGPLAFTAMACHSGLSMSNYPDGERAEPFAKSLVNSLVAQGITMFAPGGIAYSFEKKGLRQGSTILHPLRVERFTTALLEQETVGQAWVESLRDYFDSDPANLELRNEAVNLFHLNGAYGMILYGLPTQPLQQEGEKGEASHISCQPVLAPAGAATRATTDEPVDSFVLTLDIPHLTRQEDEEGGITFGLPHEGGQTGVPGGPVLPVLVRSFVLPDHLALKDIMLLDATVEDIRETVSDITLTNVPVVAEVVSEDGTVLHSTGETYELPAVYPEIPYGYVPPRAGSRLITIAAIPLQYEKETRTTTLYRRMRFKVSVVPDTDIQEAPGAIVTIPEGQVVYGNRYPQPVTVEVAHDLSDNLTLHWTISDREGSVVKSGQHFLTREYRHHVCTLNLNTQDWIPGSKDVVVSLQRGMTVLQSASVTVTVKGISMEGSLEAPPVSTPGWRATLRLHLYREGGEPLVGLDASAFTLSIMDHQGVVHFITPEGLEPLVAVEGTNSNDRRNGSVVNDGTGGYILRFSPPPGVRGDQNRLQVKVAIPGEGTEIVGTRTWSLAIPSSSVYLPLVVR